MSTTQTHDVSCDVPRCTCTITASSASADIFDEARAAGWYTVVHGGDYCPHHIHLPEGKH